MATTHPQRPADAHEHAAAMRERKRAEAEAVGVDAAYIATLVDSFYARIRDDAVLGPIFAERIHDWPVHLEQMKRFWRSILHNSGEFTGSPISKHIAIPALDASHFAHWLELFYATLRDIEPDPRASELVAGRARAIADSLLTGIAIQREGLTGARAGEGLPQLA